MALVNSPDLNRNDEIDLLELFELFWKEKVYVVAITLFITFIGAGVAYSIAPTYQASVKMTPPTLADIAELTKFDALKSSNVKRSSNDVYLEYLQILKTNAVRKNLLLSENFQTVLFGHIPSLHQRVKAIDDLIEIHEPQRGPIIAVDMTFNFQDPKVAADAANHLVHLATLVYRKQVHQAFVSAQTQEIRALQSERESLVNTHSQRVISEVAKLKEALQIAKALKVQKPSPSIDIQTSSEPRSTAATEELRYLYSQGEEALEAEIRVVSARKNDLSSVAGLTGLDQRIALLKNVFFDAENILPVNVDLRAEPPEERLKPNRLMIVASSSVFGVILALSFVLIRKKLLLRKLEP